jgi:oligoribonuclease (3'-5' exoribonuclease)
MIVWTDVETTGLDEKTGDLLEVALVVTNDQLDEVAAVSEIVVPIDRDATIAKMDPYVREMHTRNGLIRELSNSFPRPPSAPDYDRSMMERSCDFLINQMVEVFNNQPAIMTDKCVHCKFSLTSHRWNGRIESTTAECPTKNIAGQQFWFSPKFDTPISAAPLAGSTVGFDRRWLRHHMPALEALFSYRSIDVSVLTELARRFAPSIYAARPKKSEAHRALADARESINYLRYYLKSGFISDGTLSAK